LIGFAFTKTAASCQQIPATYVVGKKLLLNLDLTKDSCNFYITLKRHDSLQRRNGRIVL